MSSFHFLRIFLFVEGQKMYAVTKYVGMIAVSWHCPRHTWMYDHPIHHIVWPIPPSLIPLVSLSLPVSTLDHMSNFFYKRLDSKYFRHCRPCSLYLNYSAVDSIETNGCGCILIRPLGFGLRVEFGNGYLRPYKGERKLDVL